MQDISLADQSANRIRELILANKLSPGAHINIDALAKEFNISQTPIREALKKLIAEGFVVYKAKIGYSVRNLSLHEYLQVMEIIQVIEVYLVRELAKTNALVNIKELRGINERLRASLKTGDMAAIGRINDEFHSKLYENYPNKFMINRFKDTCNEVVSLRNFMYKNQIFTNRLIQEHEAIIEAIESGDAERAEIAMTEHYLSGRESAIRTFP